MHPAWHVGEQHTIADYTDSAEDDAKQTTLLCAVREESCDHVDGGADEVTRNSEQLDLCSGPLAQAVDDGGKES